MFSDYGVNNPKVIALRNALNTVNHELGNAYHAGHITDSTLHAFQQNLNDTMSVPGFKSGIGTMGELIHGIINTNENAFNNALPGDKGPIRALAIAPDGQTLASGGADATVQACIIHLIRNTFRLHVPQGLGRVEARSRASTAASAMNASTRTCPAACRGTLDHRRMEDRLQRAATPHEPARPHAKRVCNPVQDRPDGEQSPVMNEGS
jgi:hypothetical protein